MKNFKKLIIFTMLLMLSPVGMLFGCANKYANMKLTSNLETDTIVLIYGDEEKQSQTFELCVEGVDANVSSVIKNPYMSIEGLVDVDFNKKGNITEVTLTAISYGQTDIIFTTEEGGKTLGFTIKCVLPATDIEIKSSYKPFAVVGQTTKISTTEFLYTPSQTTQKELEFEMLETYQGVELLPDGTIIANENAQNGKFNARAICAENPDVYCNFEVTVLKGVESITAKCNNQILDEDSEVFFASNMLEEQYKIINITTQPITTSLGNSFVLNYRLLDSNGNQTSTFDSINQVLYSDIFEIYTIDKNNIGITAKKAGDEVLEITASVEGFEYVSSPIYVKLHSENLAETITVVDTDDKTEYNAYAIYDDYSGTPGKKIKVTLGGKNVFQNKGFVIRKAIESQNANKLCITTGSIDETTGEYIKAKLYSTDSTDYDIFPSGTELYLIADPNLIVGDEALDTIILEFVAEGTIGLLGAETKTTVSFSMKRGVTEIKLESQTDTVLVPIREVIGDEVLVDGTQITLYTASNEYTESIYTKSQSTGYVLSQNSVSYQDSVVEDGHRKYIFSIYGVQDGDFTISFYSQNGYKRDVRIRVFTKLDRVTLTTATIEQNSDIGQITYTTQNNFKTLDGGSIDLRLDGSVKLNFNAYFGKYLKSTNLKAITYNYSTNGVVVIDSLNKMKAVTIGETDVTVVVYTYDDQAEGTYTITFHVKTYIAVQNVHLNASNITLYTLSTLSDFEEDNISNKQKYGEYTFVLKINPDLASITNENIKVEWTGSDANNINKSEIYNSNDNTYIVKVSMDSLSLGRTEGRVKITFTVTQYNRMFVKEADILFKNATKVSQIYDVKQNLNGILTNATKFENSPLYLREDYNFDYYLYFDIRNSDDEGKISFSLSAKTYPFDALNSKLTYVYENVENYENIFTILDNQLLAQNAGLGYIDICAVDSYKLADNSYSTKVRVLVKVADGNTQSTSLEISKISDLAKINQSEQNLSKFYVITNNLNLSSQSNFTPIGYIDGEVIEFNGYVDGLLEENFGESICATISGIKLKTGYEYLGLFAKLGQNARVKNLIVDVLSLNIDTTQSVSVGALCGENAGTITNVTGIISTSNITANNINLGGITGKNTGIIQNSYGSGEVNINATECYIGGIVGINNASINGATNFFNLAEINNSYNSEIEINANYTTGAVGGIAGYSNGTIQNASFDGILNGNSNVGGIAGQIVSNNSTQLELFNSFSSGVVQGTENVGGLVGNAIGNNDNAVNISNSSVNMYEGTEAKSHIIGINNVGGLLGQANYVVIQNAYARSYINPSKVENGDIFASTNVGGIIGSANNITASKVYSIQKIVAETNVGGIFGYAYGTNIANCFERNILPQNSGYIAGLQEGTNNAQYFYSSNDDIDWTGWSFATNKTEIETGGYNWYKPAGSIYPYLIFTNNPAKLLTVEAPTSILISSISNAYLFEVKDYTTQNSEAVPNTFVLYKGKTSIIKFSKLFNVTVSPNDDLLNISKEYTISSSDTNIVQITGKTSNDYRLKFVSTGKVVLTITSKLNTDAKAEITLYVLNAVSGFDLDIESANILVNSNYELVQTFANNYINNDNFYIKFTNENAGKILINNDDQISKFAKNNEKIFIKSTKSGNFSIKYQLFVKIDIQETSYYIPLGNDDGSTLDITEKTISFDSVYGIRDFSGDSNLLEMSLNNITNLTYTLTGDDLRKDGKLPYLDWRITTSENSDMREYFNTKLVFVKVYTEDGLTIIPYEEFSGLVESDFERTIVHFENLTSYSFEQEITKIEYILEVSANQTIVKIYFDTNAEEMSFSANLTMFVKIAESVTYEIPSSAEIPTTLKVKRQKIDNIRLSYFANGEKEQSGDDEIYTINEVPSQAIINGQIGILKIALIPTNAEITGVKVSYSNDSGYVMSMNQVLKDANGDQTSYLERKPFAVATDNGKSIQLYHRESNFNGNNITTYDGYLYVAFIISSNVPTGQVFTISVDAIYAGGYHYVTSTELVSRLKSKIEIGYKFDYSYNGTAQSITYNENQVIIIPNGVKEEFYIDYTELLEADDIVRLESIVSPSTVGLPSSVKLAKTEDGKVKYSHTNSIYRVYYTIEASDVGEINLSAQMQKIQNSIQTTFKSKTVKILVVPYVITGIDIVDGTNNILTIPQSSPRELDLKITYKSSNNDNYIDEINDLIDQIKKSYSYWFGKQKNQAIYTTFSNENIYDSYYVSKSSNGIVTLSVKEPETTDIIYIQANFEYSENGVTLSANQNFEDVNIKINNITHTFKDAVTLNLTNNVSNENSIPIDTVDQFIKMSNGTNDEILYYALNSDITLSDYEPRNLENISFDGNGHKITIKNFKFTNDDSASYISKYGLFETIDSNSVVKNLTVHYDGLSSTDLTLDTSDFGLSQMYFGGVAVTNNGIIYNTKTTSNDTLSFVGNINIQTYIAGVVCENNGFVSYSTNEMDIRSNCGFVSGFVATNNKKISNSKAILENGIANTLTSSDMSLTAGFVARNRGEIFGCYISGGTISSRSTLGGFANQNTGKIDNCYSNVTVESTFRASGFVYQNDGTVTSSYSSSIMEGYNSALTPFVGTDANSKSLNSGSIDDCYFVEFDGYTVDSAATNLSQSNAKLSSNYQKFIFETNSLNGTWKITNESYPDLVDANLKIFCNRKYVGVETKLDESGEPYSVYSWTFDENPSYGKPKTEGDTIFYNPRTITNITEWDNVLTAINANQEDQTDYVVLLCDLIAERDSAPKSSKVSFKGTLFGNSMNITNLYLRAEATNTNKCFGLFEKIENATVKDLNLVARQVVASASRCVGIFAGYVTDSDVVNVNIDATNVDAIQGRNMVGSFAGLINNSNIKKINVCGSVYAGYISSNQSLKNYNEASDIEKLTSDDAEDTPYSYAGTFAGAIVGTTTASLINVTGENKVIGFYAGSCVGLVGTGSKLILASTEIVLDQYIRAFGFAGGLVGENRGTIDRCFVEHEKSVQYLIDSNTTNNNSVNGRNLEFFVGSPKFIGGLVGFNNGGTITNSYSKLDVRISNYSTIASGGFVGLDVGGNIQNCYATGSVINRYVIGGFVGIITNKVFLTSTYEQNGAQVRYDTKQLFSVNATIDDQNDVTIENSIASNKWIISSSTSAEADINFIQQSTTGLLIGMIANTHDSSVVNLSASSNYINTQVLKTTTGTIISNFNTNTNTASKTILKDVEMLKNMSGAELVNAINKISIGAYNTSLDALDVQMSDRTDSYIKAYCTKNNVLVSFENILNKDELLLDETNGIFESMQTYFVIPTTDSNSPIYPQIIENINV